jgi:hypothetical protein
MSVTARASLGVVLALAAAGPAAAQAATEMAGSVTARREGAVQVSFEPRAGVRPAVGDAVTFSTEIDGIRVDAGQGEVAEVEATAVWVLVSRGRPALGHRAVIGATGGPGTSHPPGSPGRPHTSREAASGPEYIDLPETLDTLPFTSNPQAPGAVARGGRRLLRPASGWQAFGGKAVRFMWRTEDGPLDEATHFRQNHIAVYGSRMHEMFIGILWYPRGNGQGVCRPQVNHGATGEVGIISPRSDVRVIFRPSAFMVAVKAQPGLPALMTFAAGIFAQLEPFANPCRP